MELKSTQLVFLKKYLRTKSLTVTQAKSRFGIGNLRARVAEMRQAGLKVRAEKTRDGRNKYSIVNRAK